MRCSYDLGYSVDDHSSCLAGQPGPLGILRMVMLLKVDVDCLAASSKVVQQFLGNSVVSSLLCPVVPVRKA